MARGGAARVPGVVAVNDTPMKRYFDSIHGTGKLACIPSLVTTNILVPGKRLVVAGYGFCGRGLAQKARSLGARVIVTEIDPRKALQAAHMDGFDVMTMDQAAPSAIFSSPPPEYRYHHKSALPEPKDGVILANAGHFDVEIDVE